jgi:hypothetical protein
MDKNGPWLSEKKVWRSRHSRNKDGFPSLGDVKGSFDHLLWGGFTQNLPFLSPFGSLFKVSFLSLPTPVAGACSEGETCLG